MKIVEDYIINVNTMAIVNNYDECGTLCSLIIENDNVYKVRLSPLAVIRRSIKHYGHTLQGAIKAAKNALGKISMPPVKISGKLGIYWFPTKSIEHDDCVWFSIDHIKDYQPLGYDTLKVIFHNGYEIVIESSNSRFDKKVNRARRLKDMMENRGKEYQYEKLLKKDIQIVRDPSRNHYRLDRGEFKDDVG